MNQLEIIVNNPKKFLLLNLAIVGIVILLFMLCNTNSIKVGILNLIKKYLNRSYENDNTNFKDIAQLYILPVFIVLIFMSYIDVNSTKLKIIIISFLVFIGLLFNILFFIFNLDLRKHKNIDYVFLDELLHNIYFSIIIAIMVLITSVMCFIRINYNNSMKFFLLYLICTFIFFLTIILKELFQLFASKINN